MFRLCYLCLLWLTGLSIFASRVKSRAGQPASPRVSRAKDYLPPMEDSICFWTFSRLKDPAVWLGG